MSKVQKSKMYTCPCCGYKTLEEEPPGTFDICPVCFWEDDESQFNNPDIRGGANAESLREAQRNFLKTGTGDGSNRDEIVARLIKLGEPAARYVIQQYKKDTKWKPLSKK